MKLLLSLLVLLSLTACQVDVKEENDDRKYSFSENGCETGEVKYGSDQEYCDALKDDARNKFCARSIRYERFKQDCPGQSWN